MVERKLGRGLRFLLSEAPPVEKQAESGLGYLELTQLVPNPFQPRREFKEAELSELAQSIRSLGVLEPILVRKGAGENYEIIAGERRFRASGLAGLKTVPVQVREASDDQMLQIALVENLQREDLNAIEKARGLDSLVRSGRTQGDVATMLGVSRASVANAIRLLDLPEDVQAHVSRGTLTAGHARALLGIADSGQLSVLAEQAIRDALSVREVEELVRSHVAETVGESGGQPRGSGGKRVGPHPRQAWVVDLEQGLVEALQSRVTVRVGRKRCRITIDAYGRDELDRIYRQIIGPD